MLIPKSYGGMRGSDVDNVWDGKQIKIEHKSALMLSIIQHTVCDPYSYIARLSVTVL